MLLSTAGTVSLNEVSCGVDRLASNTHGSREGAGARAITGDRLSVALVSSLGLKSLRGFSENGPRF